MSLQFPSRVAAVSAPASISLATGASSTAAQAKTPPAQVFLNRSGAPVATKPSPPTPGSATTGPSSSTAGNSSLPGSTVAANTNTPSSTSATATGTSWLTYATIGVLLIGAVMLWRHFEK